MSTAPILIVDDETEMRIAMSETLKDCGYPVMLAHSAADAWRKCKTTLPALVITDLTMPKKSGLNLLKELKASYPQLPVLIITAYGTIDTAVEAMKQGAFDYLQKPFKFDLFTFVVERALASQTSQTSQASLNLPLAPSEKPRAVTPAAPNSREIITTDVAMQRLLEVARNIAGSKATVLVESESGTGKELLAHYIHECSPRRGGPFVAVNCAALPEALLESELFGHEKGAFTGATQTHKGRFEQAHQGSLLLDEISEMALALQAKLLRVLQEHEVDRVGGQKPIPVDVRVISTTNRNLLSYVEQGRFREDLYYRLNVIPLRLPPLRERKGDLPLLAQHFIRKHALRHKRPQTKLSPATLAVLCDYNWRGNVREMENVMERALLLSEGGTIEPVHLMINPSMSAYPPSNLPSRQLSSTDGG